MKRLYILFIAFFIGVACTNSADEEILTDNVVTANLSGVIAFTLDSLAVKKNVNPRIWSLDDKSELEIKVSKNLTSNPYNLKLTLRVNKEDRNAPVLTFISDFDRKIIKGDRYRLITTLILFGSSSYIPGNTGGQIALDSSIGTYGFGFGTELEINIADEGSTIFNNNSQFLVLSGTFVYDNNRYSSLEVGNFNIRIDGNNIIDTTIF